MIDEPTADRVPTLDVDGHRFRDLDRDGVLSPYEDWRRAAGERADDLLDRLTLDEKVGLMLHGSLRAADGPMAMLGQGTSYDLAAARTQLLDRRVSSVITRLTSDPAAFAEQSNLIQDIAAEGRLGIPVTISSDPRHHVGEIFGATVTGSGFTEWPEPLGLGAVGDADVVRRFGDCVRVEYRAVGIHMSLAPQADLGTSQRWPRFAGTFGEDPDVVNALVGAYIEGAQGGRGGLHADSVACVVKHWVGYGAARDGFDGHNYYGRFSAFPAGAFADHVRAFQNAFDVGVAGVMPTYNILEGLELAGEPLEQVGAGFSEQLINGLLRRDHGFGGLVVSDWAITHDSSESCRTGEPSQGPDEIAMCWGVEDLSRVERFAKAINAGVDQLGGEEDPEPLLEAVRAGLVTESRIDDAVRRTLVQKFELGLFERPFVDPAAANAVIGDPAVAAAAVDAQRRALVVLEAARRPMIVGDDIVLADDPIADALTERGITVTDDPAVATRAVVVTATPHQQLHPGHFFGRIHHEGDTDFDVDDDEWCRIEPILSEVPTIVIVHMDRPAVVTPFCGLADALIAELGVSPDVVADVLVGRTEATGRLPFTLFRHRDDVSASPCDRPSGNTLFPRGTGVFA